MDTRRIDEHGQSVSTSGIPRPKSVMNSIDELNAFLDWRASRPKGHPVARSQVMLELIDQAENFASSSANVLLTGESGTGKELVAKLIHDASPRKDHPYVCVNCAALSVTLIESELFGHERGAFTGAADARCGRFEQANGGTILLDEISEIPINLQAKLLRVLEEDEYQRVGGNETYRVNVRIIATSNRCLEKEMAKGNFREDLFYRLNILQLNLPPVRLRREDIPLLVNHFVDRFRPEARVPIAGVSAEAMEILVAFDWPGNVRQLRNAVHRACLVNRSGIIEPADLPVMGPQDSELPEDFSGMRLEDVERHVIVASLRKFNGNKTAAAQQLGVTSRTLQNKMRQYRRLGYV